MIKDLNDSVLLSSNEECTTVSLGGNTYPVGKEKSELKAGESNPEPCVVDHDQWGGKTTLQFVHLKAKGMHSAKLRVNVVWRNQHGEFKSKTHKLEVGRKYHFTPWGTERADLQVAGQPVGERTFQKFLKKRNDDAAVQAAQLDLINRIRAEAEEEPAVV